MRITIAAVGRLKAGREREIFERHFGRARDAGRRLALTFDVREFPESRASDATRRKEEEARELSEAAGDGVLIALDENGTTIDSREFAGRIGKWRDSGTAHLAFAIGGADGLAASLTGKAALRLAFGRMTWPHQFVRLMLAEQLYRAVTILSGHPYHRD